MAHNIILADLFISAPSLFEKTSMLFSMYMQDAFNHSELLYGWSVCTHLLHSLAVYTVKAGMKWNLKIRVKRLLEQEKI